MNSAAVGFQCPSCVKEGAKSVRTARLPYGGIRVGNPTLITSILLGVNIVIWLAIQAAGGGNSVLASKLALVPNWGLRSPGVGETAEVVDGVAHGAWWQLITADFTHIEVWHIALNMMALYLFGPALEQILGRLRFLTLYLVSGLTGSAAVMLFSNAHGGTVGASGALFGVLGAMAVVAYKTGGDYQGLLSLLAINLLITFTVPSISWQGHLGGLVGGTLVGIAMVYAPKARRTLVQFTVAGAVLALSIGLIVVRAQYLHEHEFYPKDPSTFSRGLQ
ncbi:rhomboid family intramembrane serine protease [Nocardioides marmorisolisilvae]|uniref:Rhomboid family intramembrane serine protease n=2 Tax=Nocardioides marmorisolisilvae TaxID=1542737 RepID=A0A3N0DJD9_9ACTN|nr:rhomboid family intramembrane serine protease [Nocardioides marmorisolisilvae]